MLELTRCVDLICSAYPNLSADSARLTPDTGQNNRVIVLNETLVFRFPLTPGALKRLPHAVAILRALQGRTMLPVPRPIYRSREWRTLGEAFMGYPMLPGVPLQGEEIAALPETGLGQIADQLAHFLRELHSVPREMVELNLPTLYGAEYWRQMHREIQTNLFPGLAPAERAEIDARFATFLQAPDSFTCSPVLIHGDFGAGNILWDPATTGITGIIDFDAAGWGDPAIDIAAIATTSERLLASILEICPEWAPLQARAAFYRSTFALQEALHRQHSAQNPLPERIIS